LRNYRFRLYPTREQEFKLRNALEASRWLYNYFLNKNIQSLNDMQFALTELKEQETWLRNYHSKMLQMVVHKIDANRKILQSLRRKGHKVGKLNLAESWNYNSFTYNQSGFKIERHGNTDLLWLSKIGYVQIRLHREVSGIKQITLTRKTNRWYAIVCCLTVKPIFKFINPSKSVGIDAGINNFAYDSDNHAIENPLYLNKMLKPLIRANRTLSSRKKDGQNWKKTKTRLQILHERIRNKRLDFLHKTSNYYSREYDIIFLERLHTMNMVKNHHLARHILDSGWRMFKRLLDYKAKMVIEVASSYTSIDCSKCSNKVAKSLAIRIHKCNRCGLVIDRDYNASLNIKQRGLQQLLMVHEKVTPAEILCESMKQEQTIGIPNSSTHKFLSAEITVC